MSKLQNTSTVGYTIMMDQSMYHTPPDLFAALRESLDQATSAEDLFQRIVNEPFRYKKEITLLFLGIIVLLQVNTKTKVIKRVALSNTELAKNTTDVSVKQFADIDIPLDSTENIISRAVRDGEVRDTTDWKFLFTPALTAGQARINQASGGIAYSVVYPLKANTGGAIIFSYFQYQGDIGKNQRFFMQQYSQLVNEELAKFVTPE